MRSASAERMPPTRKNATMSCPEGRYGGTNARVARPSMADSLARRRGVSNAPALRRPLARLARRDCALGFGKLLPQLLDLARDAVVVVLERRLVAQRDHDQLRPLPERLQCHLHLLRRQVLGLHGRAPFDWCLTP